MVFLIWFWSTFVFLIFGIQWYGIQRVPATPVNFDIMEINVKNLLPSRKYFVRYLGKILFHTWTVFESCRLGARWIVTPRGRRRCKTNKKIVWKLLDTLHCFIDIRAVVFISLIFYQPWMPKYTVVRVFTRILSYKMPNSENCLLHEFSQICNTLSI